MGANSPGVGVKVDEIYGLAEKDFCLASVPTCFCVRLVFVHGEGRRLSTDAGASRTRATPCCFCTSRVPVRCYGSFVTMRYM